VGVDFPARAVSHFESSQKANPKRLAWYQNTTRRFDKLSPKFHLPLEGFRGFFSGETPFFVTISGTGQLLVSTFGRIVEMDVAEPLTVDPS